MQLWEPQHVRTFLPSLVVMIILGVVLRIWLGKKPEKIRMIPLQICTVFLLVIEVIKQVKSFEGGQYDLYSLPLHFCSLFLYMLPLMCFYHGKYKQQVRAIATTVSGSLFILIVIYPSLIYSGASIDNFFNGFFSFHTVAFHTVATFTFVIIVALNLHTPDFKKDAKAVLFFMIGYCVVAGIVAQVLKTNYNNFYHCNIPPLQKLKEAIEPVLGYGFAQCLYVIIVSIADLAFTHGAYQFYRLMRNVVTKIENSKFVKRISARNEK
ncbi:MAG: YwaF family protein [Clostridia bacterium]|nr:YwaF family protein [Clostridia bacterium]